MLYLNYFYVGTLYGILFVGFVSVFFLFCYFLILGKTLFKQFKAERSYRNSFIKKDEEK